MHLCWNSWKTISDWRIFVIWFMWQLIIVPIDELDNLSFAQLKHKLEIWKAIKSSVWYEYPYLFCSCNVPLYCLIKSKLNIAGVQEIWVLKPERPDFIIFQISRNNRKEKKKHQNCSKLSQDFKLKLVKEWVAKIPTKLFIPYACHYKLRFVYFLPHFSVRFIIKSG